MSGLWDLWLTLVQSTGCDHLQVGFGWQVGVMIDGSSWAVNKHTHSTLSVVLGPAGPSTNMMASQQHLPLPFLP